MRNLFCSESRQIWEADEEKLREIPSGRSLDSDPGVPVSRVSETPTSPLDKERLLIDRQLCHISPDIAFLVGRVLRRKGCVASGWVKGSRHFYMDSYFFPYCW